MGLGMGGRKWAFAWGDFSFGERRFRLPLNVACFSPAQAFRRLPRAGEGLFIFGVVGAFVS